MNPRPVAALLAACLMAAGPTPGAASDRASASAEPPHRSCHANPLGARALYLRGEFNQWAADDAHALRWACDRFELVTVLDGVTRFKIGDEGWSGDADFGAGADPARAGRLTPKGEAITHTFHGTQRIILDMTQSRTTPELRIEACPVVQANPGPLFLRGSMNNWAALDEYLLSFSCDAWYLNVKLQGRHAFKLADAVWTPAATYGARGAGAALLSEIPVDLGQGAGSRTPGELSFDFHGEHTLRLAFPGGMPTLAIGPKSFADPDEQGVDDPLALSLRHDSRALSDKTPFGAVTAGSEVSFALHSAAGVDAAWLVLESRRLEGNQDVLEYHEIARLPMTRSGGPGDESTWSARHRFQDKSVIGYYFIASIAGKQFVYGNNRDVIPWTREKGSNGPGRVEPMPASPQSIRRYRLTVYSPDFSVPSWAREAVYYYIFPDRFRNGDHRNDPRPGVDRYHDSTVELHADWNQRPFKPGTGDGSDAIYNNDFFGGDLAGIIDKLDYIHDLGANTLYITPLFRASSNHKYDTADYRNMDPHFGSNEDFARLTAEASKRGMRVIQDASLNHVGADSIYFDRYGNFGGQGAFASGRINPASPYADWFTFDPSQSMPDKQYKGWVGIGDLPELNKSSPSFRRFAYGDPDSVMLRWLDLGAAGWRMDVAPWVPDDFWREWRTAIRKHRPDALTIAETWFDSSKYFLGDMFDSTMNYIFRNTVLDYAGGGDARVAMRQLELLREAYPPPAFHALMNLLSTHDTARSLHVLGYAEGETDQARIALAKQRLRLAMFLQLTYPGAPAIFYGDEVGVTGGDDPFNRATYPWPDLGGHPDLALLADVTALLKLRRDNPVFSHGTLEAPLHVDEHVLVLARRDGEDWALTASNNGRAAATVKIKLPDGAPTLFRNPISGDLFRARPERQLDIPVAALSGIALVGVREP